MAIASIGAVSGAGAIPGGGSFAASLEKATQALSRGGAADVGSCGAAVDAGSGAPVSRHGPEGVPECAQTRRMGQVEAGATRAVAQVSEAQARLDGVLRLAERGRVFSPAELLAIQADVYRSSQVLDLAGKVVERATSGVKQILTTQL